MKEEGHNKEKVIDPLAAKVIVEYREKISAKISKDGDLNNFTVIGKGYVEINDPAAV